MINSVLIIEDDPDDRLIIKDAFLFIDNSIQVETMCDSEEALRYLDTLPSHKFPTLIVLDYNMPKINGIETLHLLKAGRRFKSIPIAILSTSQDPAFRQQCVTQGAGRYYSKPAVYSELVSIAKELVEWSSSSTR